jgi:predicted kinase
MVGNIGSGKTTYTHNHDLKNVLCKDHAREGLAQEIGEGYIWDETLEEFIHDITLDLFEASLYIGVDEVTLDETFLSLESRSYYLALAQKYEYQTRAIVFQDMGMKTHVDNRMTNHRDFSREYWEMVWTKKNESYITPTYEEGFDVIESYCWR